MGNADKGLQLLAGRPLVAHVLARLAPQVGEILISANRNRDAYARVGQAVVSDVLGEGPLAGLHAGLGAARYDVVATVPCDAPALPPDLVARLWSALEARGAEVAVATAGGLAQPVFVLVRKTVLPLLTAYLEAGKRKADGWYPAGRTIMVAFDDQAAGFANLNSAADLAAFSSSL